MISAKSVESTYGWGTDALSTFLRQAEENTFASSVNLAAEYSRLVDLHAVWLRAAEALTHTPEDDLLAVWFLQQANSAWLAAIRIGLGGQAVEPQPLLRSALEYAVYALHFTRSPALKEVWLRRHDDDDARKASREAFTIAAVKATLRREDEAVAKRFTKLYEQAIDFGAHPNERALTRRLNLRQDAGVTVSSVTQLTDKAQDYLFVARTVAQTGALCLVIFERIFRTKFQLVSLDVQIERIARSV